MNMQGVSYKNFLIIIPLLVVPMGLIGIFSLFDAKNIALIILALLGLGGIFFWRQLLKITEKQFLKRKYALCEGFRKKE
jgi:xanthosine utilization system XapX-like protein